MFGWRGRIGWIAPPVDMQSCERDQIVPKGMVVVVVTLAAVHKFVPEDFERAFELYPQAAEQLRKREVDCIVCSGSIIFTHMGYDKSQEMASHIEQSIGIPIILDITAAINALNKLSAKKIVVATPYAKERNEERKRLLQDVGFDVLDIKGAGCASDIEIVNLPPYASYKLAKDAFREAPEADAIYISCPGWEQVANIAPLERDLGKPVVTAIQANLWAALTAMRFRNPITGYGKLLEML